MRPKAQSGCPAVHWIIAVDRLIADMQFAMDSLRVGIHYPFRGHHDVTGFNWVVREVRLGTRGGDYPVDSKEACAWQVTQIHVEIGDSPVYLASYCNRCCDPDSRNLADGGHLGTGNTAVEPVHIVRPN